MLNKFFREPVNTLTHLFGALLAVAGTVFMIYDSLDKSTYIPLMASLFFGISMILLYTSSAVYHWVDARYPDALLWLKKVDHMMIFVLIAGTYTPYALIGLESPQSWIVFYSVWGIALAGIILKLVWIHAPRWLSTLFYLGMGWMSLAIFPLMSEGFSVMGFVWLGIGGLFYTVGAIIYAIKKPDPFPKVFGFHEIWHLFVIGGTFSHFWSIYNYVIPLAV